MRKIMTFQSARTAALFLATGLLGGPAAADQVIPDDLIVQGSTCSGFDCVNNESFGFNTLLLKENNLRIGFLDTSVGNFPNNDWQITANDSAAGGASYLAFDDITGAKQPFRVTAGAPTSSLFVSSSGNVGLGTAAPALELSLNTGDTPAIRMEQNNSSGFTAQTWDVAGNEANFFVRDVTGGSRLPLRIRPGAPTSSIDIKANGNVGIGTDSPLQKLHLFTQGTNVPVILFFENTGYKWSIGQNPANNFRVADNIAAVERFTIDTNGQVGIGATAPTAQLHTSGTVRFAGLPSCAAGIVTSATGQLSCAVSSARFKDIRGALSTQQALANVMALKPQVGAYKETPEELEHWLIAEDVAAVDPALAGFRDGEPYTVKTQNIVADLVAVIQEQQRRIEALEKAIAER